MLAMWQASYIKKLILEAHPEINVEFVGITTAGDKDQSQPLANIGGKSLFVKELQQALLDQRADIAVHCVKDMSVQPVAGLKMAAILKRGDPHDVFVSNQCSHIDKLPAGSVIGTSSPRRQCLVRSLYPELIVKELRGNVDTRLKKLDDGEYNAIILAAAGLKRLGLERRISSHLMKEIFVPAIGQGAMGIECRAEDTTILELFAPMHNAKTATCVAAEQAVNQVIGGDCFTPIGAYATFINEALDMNGIVGTTDGQTIIRTHLVGDPLEPETLGNAIAEALISQGAKEIIEASRS